MGSVKVIHVLGLELMRNTMVKSVFSYLHFVRSYKHLQVPFCRRPYWIQGGNVINVLGLEFYEEHNGEVTWCVAI
jgi:hypothetical protein